MKWRSLEQSTDSVDSRPLRELLAERQKNIARYVPDDIQAIHRRSIKELQNRRTELTHLSVGSKMPAFELPDQSGSTISSSELLLKGSLVVCFFRGRWCPFCVAQLEAMNVILPAILQAGASLVAISPQTVKQNAFMADQHNLLFPLLSDARSEVSKSFGLAYLVPDYQKDVYRSAFVNLPIANGNDTWLLPIPASFISDSESNIRFASSDPDYARRPEPSAILAALTSK